ncbi:hypothetical protein H1P_60033 [Hyella patelloides LEGE 07179]|uniref:Uncharacterized protein n=1 Tax=Hyella patelloides LEGE 07179 TaxID=945734 RepID=A0A563W177_9CYAN|nr:hypothetical protein H1P_60033 [Hyella patelloides LEGE 07179]
MIFFQSSVFLIIEFLQKAVNGSKKVNIKHKLNLESDNSSQKFFILTKKLELSVMSSPHSLTLRDRDYHFKKDLSKRFIFSQLMYL